MRAARRPHPSALLADDRLTVADIENIPLTLILHGILVLVQPTLLSAQIIMITYRGSGRTSSHPSATQRATEPGRAPLPFFAICPAPLRAGTR